jgi:hypothetical protein
MGHHYVGALSYADVLTLITPTLNVSQKLLSICEFFAIYDVKFNVSKSLSLTFNTNIANITSGLSLFNNVISRVPSAVHLGHHIGSDSNYCNINQATNDMYIRVNRLKYNFNKCSINVLSRLFASFCTSFYGCPIWNLYKLDKIAICYRKCLRHLYLICRSERTLYICHFCKITLILKPK